MKAYVIKFQEIILISNLKSDDLQMIIYNFRILHDRIKNQNFCIYI